MKTAVARIVILRLARGAHAKAGHRGVRPVVRNVADDGVARPAVGAVGEGIAIAPVGRIGEIAEAVGAGGHVRRNQHELAFLRLALANREVPLAQRLDLRHQHLFDARQRRRFAAQRSRRNRPARPARLPLPPPPPPTSSARIPPAPSAAPDYARTDGSPRPAPRRECGSAAAPTPRPMVAYPGTSTPPRFLNQNDHPPPSGYSRAGSALCRARICAIAHLHGGRRAGHCAGHWRRHGRLQRGGPHPVSQPSLRAGPNAWFLSGFVAPIIPQEFMLGTDYMEWRARQQPFTSLTSWAGMNDCDLTSTRPVRLACAQVEASFLPTLGIQPLLGRNFTRDEDRPNAPPVALLSYGLWNSRFAGDRGSRGKNDPARWPLRHHPRRPAAAISNCPRLEHADVLVPQAMDEAAQHRPNTGRVLQSDRAPETRRYAGASRRRASQPLFQESLQFRARAIPQRGQTARARAARPPDPRCAPGLLDSARRGAGRAADRLRQRREPACWRARPPASGSLPCASRWAPPAAGYVRQTLTESLLLAACRRRGRMRRSPSCCCASSWPSRRKASRACSRLRSICGCCCSPWRSRLFSGMVFGLVPALEHAARRNPGRMAHPGRPP